MTPCWADGMLGVRVMDSPASSFNPRTRCSATTSVWRGRKKCRRQHVARSGLHGPVATAQNDGRHGEVRAYVIPRCAGGRASSSYVALDIASRCPLRGMEMRQVTQNAAVLVKAKTSSSLPRRGLMTTCISGPGAGLNRCPDEDRTRPWASRVWPTIPLIDGRRERRAGRLEVSRVSSRRPSAR